ncbi:MAG TPA: GNAT family N-acetyltransferase [Solirubrobacterales bacterium]|nr:GNAT family N-acetyltransferase [Solirubrobacterales bacterium]
MSEPVATQAAVREAGAADVEGVATAVEGLLAELGGRMPSRAEMEAEVQALLDDPQGGSVLIAEADGKIVGVLTASWQRAIHVPGVYATVQDLWVDEDWRSRGVGAELVEAIASQARTRGVSRLEVGLPRETFAAIASTESFYRRNGFEHLGPRMRRLLDDE